MKKYLFTFLAILCLSLNSYSQDKKTREVWVEDSGQANFSGDNKNVINKSDFDKNNEIIKSSFKDAKQLLDSRKDCKTVDDCKNLLEEVKDLVDFLENKNYDAAKAHRNNLQILENENIYRKNRGLPQKQKPSVMTYDYLKKYYLRHVKPKVKSLESKIERLGAKDVEKTLVINSARNDDFWNGKSDNSQTTVANDNEDFWNGKKTILREKSNTKEKKIELEIYKENYKPGLKNRLTKKIIVKAGIYSSIEKLNSDYFVAYRKSSNTWRLRDSGKEHLGVLIDKNGEVSLKGFDYASINYHSTYGDVIHVLIIRKVEFIETYIDVMGVKKTKYKRFRDEYYYDNNLNLLKKFQTKRNTSTRADW